MAACVVAVGLAMLSGPGRAVALPIFARPLPATAFLVLALLVVVPVPLAEPFPELTGTFVETHISRAGALLFVLSMVGLIHYPMAVARSPYPGGPLYMWLVAAAVVFVVLLGRVAWLAILCSTLMSLAIDLNSGSLPVTTLADRLGDVAPAAALMLAAGLYVRNGPSDR